MNYGNLEPESLTEEARTKSKTFKLTKLKQITIKEVVEFLFSLYDQTKSLIEIIWLFLEIHLIKVILIVGFQLAIKQVTKKKLEN